ncbi:hypothetical protein [Kordia sp.]|uniref:hypothetical protein n=1 Tax=Kordia sp. TaxID=1965332 RepID=UPI0025C6DB96|nr:hypothetical protein [Kordia sp.]MCH2195359.1 hypothetical protein [Kordia sp.]
MNTLELTSVIKSENKKNSFISNFKKNFKITLQKIGREMQKHANQAGKAMRS